MPDILIKNMGMPSCCRECRLSTTDPDCYVEWCAYLEEEITDGSKKLEGCPLVEVPTHGDWHTGTPTEEGCFYALQCKGHMHPEPYFGVVVDGVFSAINWEGDLMPLPPDLIAWQKITPFEASKENT